MVPKSAPILLRNCEMVWENGFLGSTFPLWPDDGKVFDNALPPSSVWNHKLPPIGTRFFQQEQRKALQVRKKLNNQICRRFVDLKQSDNNWFRRKYREHNVYVVNRADPNRLLVMNIKEGWKPLCDFLGFDTPKEPFPFRNKVNHVTKF